jgi:hypothetical protein
MVPTPSFSKESVGGFVGFQRVTGVKNRKMMFSPNFCPAEWAQIARGTRSIRPDLTERRKTTVTQLAFLKKTNRQKIGQQINRAKTDDLPAGANNLNQGSRAP